jgi:threonine-phosphate decarboxylase
MIYGHGNELSRSKRKIIADFSSNVVYGPLSARLEKHLAQVISCISNYPEPDALSLQKKLAIHHQIGSRSLLVTNGSTEAFYMIAQLYRNKRSLILIPSFSEYEDACKQNRHRISYKDSNDMLIDIPRNIDLVWLGNPNNPDGHIRTKGSIERACKDNPKICFIVDEAYADLCLGFESCISLVDTLENLVVIRSLTKAFAIPGLRLGYLVANMELRDRIVAYKMPWSVNALAIEAGKFILDEYTSICPDIKSILTESFFLQTWLNELSFLDVLNSTCNFFLVKLLKGKSSGLKRFLVERKGVLIRDASNFKGLDEAWIRLSVQDPTYNNLLYEGLQEWMK